MMGIMLLRKFIFVIRYEKLIRDPAPLVIASLMKNQGIIPHTSHSTKGIDGSIFPALKPKEKTNHMTTIEMKGCINAQ